MLILIQDFSIPRYEECITIWELRSRKAHHNDAGGAINVQFVDTLKVSNVIFDLNTVGNSMGDR